MERQVISDTKGAEMDDTGEHVVSVRDAAAHFSVHPETIRRKIRRGELPCYKHGSLIRIDLNLLKKLFSQHGQAIR